MLDMPAVGDEFAGYRLLAILGRGPTGTVYQAEDPDVGDVVALRVVDRELGADEAFRDQFLAEAALVAGLRHPHIVPVYDSGTADGLLYLAMRYVDGTDLRRALQERWALPPDTAVFLLGQAAGALDAAHRAGLVHGGVRPASVLVEPDAEADGPDRVFLAGFGTGRHGGSGASGQFPGAVNYVSPEQVTGQPVLDAADQYSLGCVLYECLTGAVPFERDSDAAVARAHVAERAADPTALRPELPPGLDEVLARALAKEPGDRYASCGEFLAAAADALVAEAVMSEAGRPGPAAQESPGYAAPAYAAPAYEPAAYAAESPAGAPGPRRGAPVAAAAWAGVAAHELADRPGRGPLRGPAPDLGLGAGAAGGGWPPAGPADGAARAGASGGTGWPGRGRGRGPARSRRPLALYVAVALAVVTAVALTLVKVAGGGSDHLALSGSGTTPSTGTAQAQAAPSAGQGSTAVAGSAPAPGSTAAGTPTGSGAGTPLPQGTSGPTTLAGVLADANNSVEGHGLLPPGRCGQYRPTATGAIVCQNPVPGVAEIYYQSYPSVRALYTAYRDQVSKMDGGVFKENTRTCGNSAVGYTEFGWNQEEGHPHNFTVAQMAAGKVPQIFAAGRMACFAVRTPHGVTQDIVWTIDGGPAIGVAVGDDSGNARAVYQLWASLHHAVLFRGTEMCGTAERMNFAEIPTGNLKVLPACPPGVEAVPAPPPA
jgi:hypothetical protein